MMTGTKTLILLTCLSFVNVQSRIGPIRILTGLNTIFRTALSIYELLPGDDVKTRVDKILHMLEDFRRKTNTDLQEIKDKISDEAEFQRILGGLGEDFTELELHLEDCQEMNVNKTTDRNRRWFTRALDSNNGLEQILRKIDKSIVNPSIALDTKGYLLIRIDRIQATGNNFWESVDFVIKYLVDKQIEGYLCLATAINISRKLEPTTLKSSEILREGKKKLRRQFKHMYSFFYDERLMIWPKGAFGMVKPKISGCPKHGTWLEGSVYENTEDGVANEGSWGITDLDIQFDDDIQWNFCMHEIKPLQTDLKWPIGNYCFFKFQSEPCPPAFKEGSVQLDDSVSNNIGSTKNTQTGAYPDGTYDENTKFLFCCRNDGDTSRSIALPISNPFSLLPYKNNKCQQVAYMDVKEHWITVNTQEGMFGFDNLNELEGSHPKIIKADKWNDYEIYFCYYSRTKYIQITKDIVDNNEIGVDNIENLDTSSGSSHMTVTFMLCNFRPGFIVEILLLLLTHKYIVK